jgi:ankyrin repeat domain-containing protein 50
MPSTPVQIGSLKFTDGALSSINPIHEVYEEASKIWHHKPGDSNSAAHCLVSVGIGLTSEIEGRYSDMLERAVQEAEEIALRFKLSVPNYPYFRFNLTQNLAGIGVGAESRRTVKDATIEAATEFYLAQSEIMKHCLQELRGTQRIGHAAGTDKQTLLDKVPEFSEFLRRLYVCPYGEYKDRNCDRLPGTCEWFTSHPIFQDWNKTQGVGLLLVFANPGCGKSVLAKYLVDYVLPSTSNRTICYFFFKDDSIDSSTTTAALCAILYQIFQAKPYLLQHSIIHKLDPDWDPDWDDAAPTYSFRRLWNALITIAADQSAGEIVCILDALDECRYSDRSQLVQAVRDLHVAEPNKVRLKFLWTSRPYGQIRREFQNLEKPLSTIRIIEANDTESDEMAREVGLVIKSGVENIGRKQSLEQDEVLFLEKQLMRVPNRTYLWVTSTLDSIESSLQVKPSKANFRQLIAEMPQTVQETYDRILENTPDAGTAMKLLHIIIAAIRPLTLEEMSLAIAINDTHRSCDELIQDLRSEPKRFLWQICGPLIVISNAKVYLLHSTVKEFLVRDGFAQNGPLKSKYSLQPEVSNRILAEICIRYLTLDSIRTRLPALLDYSAKNWADHFRKAGIRSEEEISISAQSLCETESKQYKTWYSIYASYKYGPPESATSIIIASYLGLEAVVKLLLKMGKTKIDSKDDGYDQTPLSWAAKFGHEAVVKLLLDAKADINPKDDGGRTPLLWAAENGHEAVVKLLLGAKADIDSKDDSGRTPLSWAAENGREAIVKLLLDAKADIDSKDDRGRTPLLWAAENGREAIVKLLLEAKADINLKDTDYGQTPISRAAENGHEAVVKLLLDAKADIDSKDDRGRTPLSWAAEKGREAIFKLLLDAKANIDSKDNSGRTPLSWAAENGREAIVKLLLEAKADINLKDTDYGQIPLSWAAEKGHEAVVKLLLEAKADINLKDTNFGQTPLSWAAENGREAVVKLLLEAKAAIDLKDNTGRTPLLWAAENGHEAVVKLLLEAKAAIDLKDNTGQTPLSRAAENGRKAVVKLLLEAKAAIDLKDNTGRTPLL